MASAPRNGWAGQPFGLPIDVKVTTMHDLDQAIREAAYFIWEREGCPNGRADEHWCRDAAEIDNGSSEPLLGEEEKIMADRPDANWPALLTKDVHGG